MRRAPSGRQIVPSTSLPGQEIAPTFSPDGSQIAFAWNGEAEPVIRLDLYVKSLGSERLLRLTHESCELDRCRPGRRTAARLRPENKNDGSGIFVIPALREAAPNDRIVSTAVAVGSFLGRSAGRRMAGRRLFRVGPSGAAQVYIVAVDSLVTQPLRPHPTVWMRQSLSSRRTANSSPWCAFRARRCIPFMSWSCRRDRCGNSPRSWAIHKGSPGPRMGAG